MVTELVLDTAVASTPSYAHIAHSICWNQVRKKKVSNFCYHSWICGRAWSKTDPSMFNRRKALKSDGKNIDLI